MPKKIERRFAPKTWKAVNSFARIGDRIVAGENGGTSVCAWTKDGAIAWETSLGNRGKGSRYEYASFACTNDSR